MTELRDLQEVTAALRQEVDKLRTEREKMEADLLAALERAEKSDLQIRAMKALAEEIVATYGPPRKPGVSGIWPSTLDRLMVEYLEGIEKQERPS